MNERKLLIDVMTFEPVKQSLMEALTGEGPFTVKGILQRAEAKNQNGRTYPFHTLQREAQKYDEGFIKERRALGELDHPESQVVNLKNVSHNVIEMHWEGKDLMGTVEVLSTPSGNILKELFKSNIRLGISSRGLGTIKKISESLDQVQDDFELIAFDFVSNPSTRGAFMFPTNNSELSLTEGVNHLIKNPITDKWVTAESIIQDIFSELT
jgi:hypothetical protein